MHTYVTIRCTYLCYVLYLFGNQADRISKTKTAAEVIASEEAEAEKEAATRRLSNFGGQKSGGRLGKAVRKWGAISAFSNKKKSPNPFFRQPAEHPGYGSNATADGNVACPEEEEEDRNDTEGEDYDDNDDARQGSGGRRNSSSGCRVFQRRCGFVSFCW